ncbi:hypothetical protein KP509_30G065600 [Ceratopteris richardii]|uniref:Maintenance of Photosystem II under High light 2 C-terminal domain-containing protein n=1 Tax=Ceratopteris richardii TaxID=49495 RepID=A0A8T2R472_CERRI|nr:hypothetical protein KP509_30G065600 [Ceratopteris richardii]
MASSLVSSFSSFSGSCIQQRLQQSRRILCKACHCESSPIEKPYLATNKDASTRRQVLTAVTACGLFLPLNNVAFALLEADDDEELLEKVKEDRKKKIKRRGEINSFKEETAYLQAAVYQLSRTGQALDANDFSAASKLLGGSLSEGWIANAEQALSKVSSSAEEQNEASVFSASLASLQTAVSKQDMDLCRSAFVESANALEKWSFMTGFADQLKGL